MTHPNQKVRFEAKLLRPRSQDDDHSWAFVVLPRDTSALLPRRGRTTIECTIKKHKFQVTLEPDGKLSHWLRIDEPILKATGIKACDIISLEITPVDQEPEPAIPADFRESLESHLAAFRIWNDTSTIARIDWIHWITSAKQAKTRAKRVKDACDMLAAGKKRVCCFDPSGYYSKALSAPEVEK